MNSFAPASWSLINRSAKAPGLNIRQHTLHVGFHIGGDHARAGNVVAVFGGVADRPALLGDTALVDEVDDELQFVEHLEVGDFGLVAGFGENFKAVLDQLRSSTTENGLLTEQVGFGLFGEGGHDSTGAQATEALGVGPGEVPGVAGGVVFDGDDDGGHHDRRHIRGARCGRGPWEQRESRQHPAGVGCSQSEC